MSGWKPTRYTACAEVELAAWAGDRPLCCEVDLWPPNPASLAFHARLGVRACGEARDPRSGKRVQ